MKVRGQREGVVSLDTKSTGAIILDFPASRTDKCLFISHPVYGVFVVAALTD